MPELPDLAAEYLALTEEEREAEQEALEISNEIRDRLQVSDDGKVTGQPTAADMGREAGAWAEVGELRTKRHEWVARQKVAAEPPLTQNRTDFGFIPSGDKTKKPSKM